MNFKQYYIISKKHVIQYFGNNILSKTNFILTCVANALTLKMRCVSIRIYPIYNTNLTFKPKTLFFNLRGKRMAYEMPHFGRGFIPAQNGAIRGCTHLSHI